MTDIANRLARDLEQYDGRAITLLSECYARHASKPGFVDGLIVLIGHDRDETSDGATWMLKYHCEQSSPLAKGYTKQLIEKLGSIHSWQSCLHVCQCADYFEVSIEDAQIYAEWLAPLTIHQRPFIRAWSMHALCRLAEQHDQFSSLATKAKQNALNDPASSVRARARNI
ncbi:hypothetical protein FF098_007455 [Parvularcula flava]|uniref:Uncharacterized protein n=1 Tax=Aquisalinus luteolus TaxID=1566827 RepID=A0A8J3A702_9PROT|nr:hypothetical protein [Aquisalinus luteolus]NHK27733.1 hypothetical protein [Aquisalinus luteolus]GGH96335.1 hypothetical protein GCM10011355_14990 [Aquisalinus luteolus]